MPSKTTSAFAAFHGIVVCVLWCGGFAWFSVGFQFFFSECFLLPGEYVKRLRPAEGRGARAFDPTCLHKVGDAVWFTPAWGKSSFDI